MLVADELFYKEVGMNSVPNTVRILVSPLYITIVPVYFALTDGFSAGMNSPHAECKLVHFTLNA